MYDLVCGKGYYIINDIDLDQDSFVELSSKFGKLWEPIDHDNAKETLNGKTVEWSSKNDFVAMSIPWHADNPASKDKKFPLRTFYAVNIPDPEDAKLYFLDTVKGFEGFSEERKEYLRQCRIVVGEDPSFKKKQAKFTFAEPWEEPFIKTHPITGAENPNYGCMGLDSDVFGVGPDEGFQDTESYNKAILHPDGTKWTDAEVSEFFQDMIDIAGVYEHKWQERQFLIMDNWTHLHYKQTTKIRDEERLIWRRTVFQPWQNITTN